MASDLVMPIIGDDGRDGNFEVENSTQWEIFAKFVSFKSYSIQNSGFLGLLGRDPSAP